MLGYEDESFFSTKGEFDEAREKVLALTGLDIAAGHVSSGSRNITYVLSESVRPSVIRISYADVKPIKDVYGELMFVDYLREHVRTVCNPVPFDNRLVNVITVAGTEYYVVVSRKANGISPADADFDNERIFELYGEKIGQLHAASRTSFEEGFHFQRPVWTEAPGFDFGRNGLGESIPADVMEVMVRIRDRVAALPRTPETFGMIHGDMTPLNTFLDWDDVWLFDFDDSCYHYFMYDMAAFLFQGIRYAHAAGDAFDPVACLRRGYERANALPGECWSDEYVHAFLDLRCASAAWVVGQARTPAGLKLAKRVLPSMFELLRGMGA
ncbi:MAG: phosphotransferase [Atopobiaceae bacterium]|jgi:Ser/Thr protein kinase RdoA (MazF antagonist)|nr:phosphotransferase [Atopobiaceae bacterium]